MRTILILLLLSASGCRAIRLGAPLVAGPDDWTMTGGSFQHNTRYAGSLRPPLAPVWEYNAEAAFGPGGAIVVGDVVIVGTRQGEVHAIDVRKGGRKGVARIKEPVEGTPVLDSGMLYFATSWGSKTMVGYDVMRGGQVWREEGDPVEAGPVLVDGTLVMATVTGEVIAREPESGSIRWIDGPAGGPITSTPVSADGRAVVVADQDGLVRAVGARHGGEIWRTDVGAPVYEALTAIEDQIIVPTTRGTVVSLDAGTGMVRWRFATDDRRVRFAPAAGDGDIVVFGATDAFIRAVDPRTGHLLWATQLDDGMSAQPLVADDAVWIGTLGGMLVALDITDGHVLWTGELPGRARSAITPHDGGLIVLSEPRIVTYFRPGEVSDDE